MFEIRCLLKLPDLGGKTRCRFQHGPQNCLTGVRCVTALPFSLDPVGMCVCVHNWRDKKEEEEEDEGENEQREAEGLGRKKGKESKEKRR